AQTWFPPLFAEIVKSGGAGHRMTASVRAERFRENPFSGRNPTGRAIEDAPLGAAEPAQFGRPERSAQHAAGLRVNFSFIEFAAQLRRIWRAPRIGPGKHRCDWPVVSVNAKIGRASCRERVEIAVAGV